jgi:Polyketide cyclase / dehydrase and lipid transport
MVHWYQCTKKTNLMRARLPAVIAALIPLWSTVAMPSPPATQMRTFHLDAPLARVFPLFTANGEREWAPGWEPRILSGAEERGSAFITTAHNGGLVTWIVTDYRPAQGRVSYARLVQESNIGLVDVSCTEASGGTDVSVRYTLTAVSEAGESFVAQFLNDEHYTRMIDEWQAATRKALRLPATP